jgi:hypothetical protein
MTLTSRNGHCGMKKTHGKDDGGKDGGLHRGFREW